MIPLYDDQPSRSTPVVTVLLILANAAVFIFWQLGVGLEESIEIGALVPYELTHHVPGAFTRIWTSMFMHGGWMHLLGNMWFLWIFGDNVEDVCGKFGYLCFYLACGALATVAYALSDPSSTTPMLGASGAISGVLGAYLVKFPRASVRTLIPLGIFTRIIDVPAFVFLLFWIGMQLFFQVAASAQMAAAHHHESGGVAYLAHLGGFVAGIILIFLFQNRGDREDDDVRYEPPGRW